MATIEQDLAQIRQAVYGEEVREAIADGIEQCYQDSTANGQMERIIAKGLETYNSIPSDYSSLSDQVGYLSSAFSKGAYSEAADWSNIATSANTLGWSTGIINAETGNEEGSSRAIRSVRFYPSDGAAFLLVATAPAGYAIAAYEWDETGAFVKRHGIYNTAVAGATNSLFIPFEKGHRFRFVVGWFASGSASTYITSEFISGINVTYVKNVDESLSVQYIPADAKATGDKINEVMSALSGAESSLGNNQAAQIEGRYLLPAVFTHGTRTNRNVFSVLNYRVTTVEPVLFSERVYFHIRDGFTARFIEIKDDGTYQQSTNTEYVSIPPNRKFNVVIQRTNEDTTETADMHEFVSAIYHTNESQDQIDSLTVLADNVRRPPTTYIHGSRDAGNRIQKADYRITSPEPFVSVTSEPYHVSDGFTVKVQRFIDGEISAEEEYTDTFVITKGNAYALTIKRTDEDVTEIADMREFASAVYLPDHIAETIEDYGKTIEEYRQSTNARIESSILPTTFKRGYMPTGTTVQDISYSIYSVDDFSFDEPVNYIIIPGFRVRVYMYDKSTGQYRSSLWFTERVRFSTTYRFKVSIFRADSDQDVSEIADVKEFAKAVYLEDEKSVTYIETPFAIGSISTQDAVQALNYRVYTPEKFHTDKRKTYTIASGFKVDAVQYDHSTSEKLRRISNITGKMSLNPLYDYKFVIMRETEDTSETATVSEFAGAVKQIPTITDKHLSILILGNSHSSDSWVYVPFMLLSYGITCEIYWSYRGAGSLDRWVAEWNDTGEKGSDPWGGAHIRRLTHIDTRYEDSWDNAKTGYSTKNAVEIANDPDKNISWDLIVIQSITDTQAESRSQNRNGIEPSMRQFISLITGSYKKPFVLGWFTSIPVVYPITYGGYNIPTSERDDRIGLIKTTEAVMANEPIDLLFPVGTAVINARTNSDLASKNVSSLGNLFYTDGLHLQHGVPCYIANATIVESLFRKFFPEYSIFNDQTRILTDNVHINWNCPFQANHGTVLATDEQLYKLAQKCVIAACNNPYDITPIYSYNSSAEIKTIGTYQKYWADELITRPDPSEIGQAGSDT